MPDATTFTAAFTRWHGPVFGYLFNELGDSETAHDLAQDVFLYAWRVWVGHEPLLSTKAWIMRLAHNRLVDYRRQGARRAHHLAGYQPRRTALHSWGALDAMLDIESAWPKLRQRHRDALVIAAEGYEGKEGGAYMGLSANAFNAVVFRGREKLGELTR